MLDSSREGCVPFRQKNRGCFPPPGGHHTITGAKRPPPGFTDPEKMHPFATLVTSDAHDQASDLKWPSNPHAHDP